VDILTVDAVAELLCCDPQTVREATRQGRLPAVKFGRDWVYPRQALLDALNAMAKQRPEPEVRTLAVAVPQPERRLRRVPPPLPQL